MALYSQTFGTITLTAAATKSIVLLNPATVNFKVVRFSLSMDNVTTNAEPVQIDLYRVNVLGSPAGSSAIVPVPLYEGDPTTAQTTALYALSTEPTSAYILDSWFVSPNGGLLYIEYGEGREPEAKGAGARYGLRYTTVTGVTPKLTGSIHFAE